jgi:hypothetical protein
MLDKHQSQRKPLTPHQERQAIEMHEAGMSNKAIAHKLGYGSDLIIRQLFMPKKPKPIKSKTPSVLVHHVITSSTSVPIKRRYYSPPPNYHSPTREELCAMLYQAVRNTRC